MLTLLVKVKVSQRSVELLLDARPRGEGAAATKGNAVHQELPLNIIPQTTVKGEGAENEKLAVVKKKTQTCC